MTVNLQDVVARFFRAQLDAPDHVAHPGGAKPVITIARDYGAGGEEIGRILAKALQIEYFDREILDRIARAAGTDPAMLRILDERSVDRMGIWLSSLINHSQFQPTQYLRHLITIVATIARGGGVIMGRGCHLILRSDSVVRLRIIGSPEICARRLAGREDGDEKALVERVRHVNEDRSRFVWDHFHVRMNEPHAFDMIVNTDHFPDLTRLADVLVELIRVHMASHTAAHAAA